MIFLSKKSAKLPISIGIAYGQALFPRLARKTLTYDDVVTEHKPQKVFCLFSAPFRNGAGKVFPVKAGASFWALFKGPLKCLFRRTEKHQYLLNFFTFYHDFPFKEVGKLPINALFKTLRGKPCFQGLPLVPIETLHCPQEAGFWCVFSVTTRRI